MNLAAIAWIFTSRFSLKKRINQHLPLLSKWTHKTKVVIAQYFDKIENLKFIV